MKIIVTLFVLGFFSVSCLKKIEAVEELNTNIFDPEYDGEQWFDIDTIFTYTNSNNDQRVQIQYTISSDKFYQLKPVGLSITSDCNQYLTSQDTAVLNVQGDFKGGWGNTPDGSSEYCLTLGLYDWKNDTTFNRFTECVSL